MQAQADETQPFGARARGWFVHGYTALGAAAAFAGTIAVFEGRYRTAFLIMVATTLIDATDGLLARVARVKEVIPEFDGARLDDIVDYLTFVFLPTLALYVARDLPEAPALAMLLSSAYGFGSVDAKTDDHFFTGFPSYWNVVAFYLHAARLPPLVNSAIVLALAGLVFVRIGYVYPSRTPVLRRLTLALAVIWGAVMVWMILLLPEVPPALLLGSLAFPVYYVVLSLVLHMRRKSRSG